MGLDQYFYAEKTLSAFKKKEKLYIDYFNTLSEPDLQTDEGLFVSEYWGNGAVINNVLKSLPKLDGQVGDIKMVKKVGDDYIVSTEAMYWRKANQIHDWFVKNAQDGIDDCLTYPVSIICLVYLYDDITTILDGVRFPSKDRMYKDTNKWNAPLANISLAQELLPTSSGFFFGDTHYNKWYFDDLRNTKKFLRRVLKQTTRNNWTFNYHSSW